MKSNVSNTLGLKRCSINRDKKINKYDPFSYQAYF